MVIRQLGLRGPFPGESTLVELPGGGVLLIDVGNDSHDGWIRERLREPVEALLITHEHEDHAGGLAALEDLLDGAERIDRLGTWSLGEAELEVFLHDGVLRAGGEDLDLRDLIAGMDADPNARSTAGVLRYGAFSYLFAGDLPGGGKGVADLESVVAARRPVMDRVELLHLSHHGIRTSTNEAWTDWLLPEDGETRNALVGANRGYLAAPSEEVMDRVAPRLGEGFVWASRVGLFGAEHERLRVAAGDVIVAVEEGGARYRVCDELFESLD
jgi:hypothetical protein